MTIRLSSIEARWNDADDAAELWVDGRSVIDMFKGSGPEKPDGISPFARRHAKSCVLQSLASYGEPSVRGNAELPPGVLELAVCSACADWRCGSFSVRLKRDGEFVEWFSPNWAFPDMDDADFEQEPFEPGDPMSWFPQRLTFRAPEYDAALDKLEALMVEHPWPVLSELASKPSRLRSWFTRLRRQVAATPSE